MDDQANTTTFDTERIFTYRALAFARKDKEIIPPFDENEYSEAAQVSHRSLADLVDEYKNVRKSLQRLYLSFTPEMLQNTGKMTSEKYLFWLSLLF